MSSFAFNPNCTVPRVPVVYVSSTNIRGTLNILFSSLATILACTYTLLHLNVPKQRRQMDAGWRGHFERSRILSGLKWSAFAVLIPEFILAKYVLDWCNARLQLHLLYQTFPRTRSSWTLTHMFFADMGGFVVEYRPNNPSTPPLPLHPAETSVPKVMTHTPMISDAIGLHAPSAKDEKDLERAEVADKTSTHICEQEQDLIRQCSIHTLVASSSIDSGVNSVRKPWKAFHNGQRETRRISVGNYGTVGASFYDPTVVELWHLDAFTLRRTIEEGYLSLNVPTRAEILDRSKSDAFAKLIAMLQPVYFVIEVIVRAVHHLPITQLEIGVMGFVLCATVAYGFALAKPKAVATTITLGSYNGPIPPRFGELARRSTMVTLFQIPQPPGCPNSNDRLVNLCNKKLLKIFMLVGCFTTVLFGAVCLAAWDFTFRTTADLWLWRIASLVSATIFPIYALVLLPWRFIRRKDLILTHAVFEEAALGSIAMLLQSASRVIVVVEMFRCLIYLPPGAYITTNIVNLPHIG